MKQTHYYKRYQEGEIWHYYKLLYGREPIAYELINFLNPIPSIHFMELDLDFIGCKSQYDSLWEVGTEISDQEYGEAWKRATKSEFEIYLQGKQVKA